MQQHAGKLIIICIFLVGFGSAGAAIWFRYTHTRQVLEYYGGETAELITSKESPVTLYQLENGQKSTAGKLVSKAPGFHNARNAIVLDTSYDWSDTRAPETLAWQYAMEIEEFEGPRRIALLFSENCEYVMLEDQTDDLDGPLKPVKALGVAVRAAAMSEGLDKLFSEQFTELDKIEESPQ